MDASPCLLLAIAGRGIVLFAMCNNHAADHSKQSGNPGNRKNFLHMGVLSDIHVWVSQLVTSCSSSEPQKRLQQQRR